MVADQCHRFRCMPSRRVGGRAASGRVVGVGKIALQAVPGDQGVGFRRRLPLSITLDHCIVTGGEAGRFLKAMIDDLEKPP